MTVTEYCDSVRALARAELARIKAEMPWMVEQLALTALENNLADLPSEDVAARYKQEFKHEGAV